MLQTRENTRTLSLRMTHSPGITTIGVAGELDVYTAEDLRSALKAALELGRDVSTLRVELRRVTFVDSVGLAVLVGALRQAQEAGIKLELESPSGAVQRLLELSGLARLFQMR